MEQELQPRKMAIRLLLRCYIYVRVEPKSRTSSCSLVEMVLCKRSDPELLNIGFCLS